MGVSEFHVELVCVYMTTWHNGIKTARVGVGSISGCDTQCRATFVQNRRDHQRMQAIVLGNLSMVARSCSKQLEACERLRWVLIQVAVWHGICLFLLAAHCNKQVDNVCGPVLSPDDSSGNGHGWVPCLVPVLVPSHCVRRRFRRLGSRFFCFCPLRFFSSRRFRLFCH